LGRKPGGLQMSCLTRLQFTEASRYSIQCSMTQLQLPFRVTLFDESKLRAKKCVASITTKLVEIVIFRTNLFRGLAPRHSWAWTATKLTLEPSGGGRTAVSSNCRHALIDMILHGIAALCKGGPPKVRINFNCEQIFHALHRR
jgi:hypothetical protein